MKEKYEELIIETIVFETEDIITGSDELPYIPSSIDSDL